MNKEPLKSLQLLCHCGNSIPFDSSQMKLQMQCDNCSRTIRVSFCSLLQEDTMSARKVAIRFENILRSGSDSEIKEIFRNHLDQMAAELEENKNVYFLLGIGPYDIREEKSFCKYYGNYKNPLFPVCTIRNHPSQPSIEDTFKVTVESGREYYIICYSVPFYSDMGIGDKYDFPNVEFFVRVHIQDENNWSLLDGKLIWVTLHPEAGPFAPKSNRKTIQISKKQLGKITEEFGDEVARVIKPFTDWNVGFSEYVSSEMAALAPLTQEQFDKEIRFHKLEEKRDKLEKIAKEGCFIATATYGDYGHPKVEIFRTFRDQRLANDRFGRHFIRIYYKMSPFFSRLIRRSFLLKSILRFFLDILADVIRRSA